MLLLWPRLNNIVTPPRIALIVDLVEGPTSGTDGAEVAEGPAAAMSPTPPAAATPAGRTDAPPVSPAAKSAEARPTQPPAGDAATVGDLLRGAEAAHGGAAAPALDSGGSGVLDASDAGGTGATSLKDFIRVQIERRWQIDPNTPDVLVTLRLVIASDGSVVLAEPMNDGGEDRVYRALALAARNAALLSSPLQFPRGTFAVTGEMIIDLNTRDTRR